jgi:4-amino-4-deoxychorismate lyase
MSQNNDIKVLSAEEALSNLKAYGNPKRMQYKAMYSSVYGGIVLDESLMTIPIDDHMCHRGHAVFDTATVENGYLYNASVHIDRILNSAVRAEIVHPFTKEWIKSVLIAVCKASNSRNISLRYWISAGAGDFSYSPQGCIASSFYCIAFQGFHLPSNPDGISEVTVSSSEVGMKQHPIGTLKSTNYLANVLLHITATRRGGVYGIWVGSDGFIKEGPINSVIILDSSGVVRTPPFTDILASCTCKRVLSIAESLGYNVIQENITVESAYAASEMILVGGDIHVISVTKLDNNAIGTGVPGLFFNQVRDKILQEAHNGTYECEPIPFE